MSALVAQWAGVCASCGRPIVPGEKIVSTGGSGERQWIHFGCHWIERIRHHRGDWIS